MLSELIELDDCKVKAKLNSATVLGVEKYEAEIEGVFDEEGNCIDKKFTPEEFEEIKDILINKKI
mgnify:CR=1 FL=1